MRSCAVCRAPAAGAAPEAIPIEELGIDGYPAGNAAELGRLFALETCSACGHLAPDITLSYRHVADARQELLTLPGHAPEAQRFLAVAALFEDPDSEGTWVLRAAWADHASGLIEAARALRRRAGALLESAGCSSVRASCLPTSSASQAT